MPIIKNNYKKNFTTKSNLRRKSSLKIFLGLIVLTLLAVALPVVYILVNQNQDIRQQAYDTIPSTSGTGGST